MNEVGGVQVALPLLSLSLCFDFPPFLLCLSVFPGSCFLDLVLQFEYEDKWDGMGELLDKEAAKI